MVLKYVCKKVGRFAGEAIGDIICPGVGGTIGRMIGGALGNGYSGIASDPENWVEGIAYKADCIREFGFDPTDFL